MLFVLITDQVNLYHYGLRGIKGLPVIIMLDHDDLVSSQSERILYDSFNW